MMIGIWVAAAVLSLAVLIGLYRVATATDGASRAVVGDLVFFSGIGLLVLLGILSDSAAVVDAALLASLLGILATIALARIITRGHR
ncbi:monovalent cation/H+ antiporter complex subunit F [Austwickia chelonae]|uniref:monovalent cation/H+ antiporter complex subunit F n=1 Tax=Austwickia chelonae TaxID=100225 RepID=UPI000E260A37|nr:monovalent cation/H+ antiporter complex subunit F [Austwickia chelonae]